MAKSTFIVLESEPRNTQQTSAVSSTARPSSIAISLTESWMKPVVSKMTSSFIPGGRVFCRVADRRGDRLGHADGVGAGLLEDAHRLDGRAVAPRVRGDVDEAVLDEGDVLNPDDGAAGVADDDVAQGVEVRRLADDPHVELAAAAVEGAPGDVDVLLLDRRHHVGHGDAGGDELVGVDPDADVAVEVPHRRDLPDAGDGLEHVLDLVARDVREELARERPRQADRHDRLVVGVALRDHGRHGARRHRSLDLRDLRLGVLQGEVDVAREIEGRGHPGGALRGRRRQRDDARHLRHRIFDRVDDPGLDVLRGSAGPRNGHRDRRVVDVRILADADPRDGDDAEQDRPGHDHPRKHRLAQADVGQVHWSFLR